MNESERAIDDALRRLVRKRRRVAALRACIVGLSLAAAWLLASAMLDRWNPERRTVRYASLGVTASVVLWTICRAIRLIVSGRYDAIQASRQAESADPAWGERLSTVVTQLQLAERDRGSFRLVSVLVDDAANEIRARPPAKRVKLAAARRALTLAGIVIMAWLAALIVPGIALPQLIERQAMPWAEALPVTDTQIDLLRHSSAISQGQSLTVVADLNREAEPVLLNFGLDLQHLRPLPMERTYGLRYSVTLITPQADFVYRVTAGDAITPPVRVRVVRTPGVVTMDATLTYNDGRPPRQIQGTDGNFRVPAGTQIGVTFRATDPLRSAAIRVGHDTIAATGSDDKRTWQATFIASVDCSWSIDLRSDRGARGHGPTDMQIRVDAPEATQQIELNTR